MTLTTADYQRYISYAAALLHHRPAASLPPAELVHHAWEVIASSGAAFGDEQFKKAIRTAVYALAPVRPYHLEYREDYPVAPPTTLLYRICTGCRDSLPAGAFYRCLTGQGTPWVDTLCKTCRSAAKKHYYRTHKQQIVSRTVAYHKANPVVKKLSAIKAQKQRIITAPATCTTCEQELPPCAFRVHRNATKTLQWLSYECRKCNSTRRQRYYLQNRESILKQQKEYYASKKQDQRSGKYDGNISYSNT